MNKWLTRNRWIRIRHWVNSVSMTHIWGHNKRMSVRRNFSILKDNIGNNQTTCVNIRAYSYVTGQQNYLLAICQKRNFRAKGRRIKFWVCRNSRYIRMRSMPSIESWREHCFCNLFWTQTIKVPIIKLMLQVINVIFFLITINSGLPAVINSYSQKEMCKIFTCTKGQWSLTLDALVSGFALRTGLISLPSLILIARPAHWESTFIAGNKWLSIHSDLNLIPTYLTHLPAQLLHRLYLYAKRTKWVYQYSNIIHKANS